MPSQIKELILALLYVLIYGVGDKINLYLYFYMRLYMQSPIKALLLWLTDMSLFFFLDKAVRLNDGGSVINGAYPV